MSQADDFSTENKLVDVYQKLIDIIESDPMQMLELGEASWLNEKDRLKIVEQILTILQTMQSLIDELLLKTISGIHNTDDKFFEETNNAYYNLKNILQVILIDRNVPGAHIKAVEAFRALDFIRKKEEDDLDNGESDYISSEISTAQKQIDAISLQFHELEDKIKKLYGLYKKETPIKSLSIRGDRKEKSEEDDGDEDEFVHEYTDSDLFKQFSSAAVANAIKLFKSSEPFTNGMLYPNEGKLTLMQMLVKELYKFFQGNDNQLEFTKAFAHQEYKALFRQYCFDKFCSEVDFTGKGYVMYNYGMEADDINALFAKIVTGFSREHSPQQFIEGLAKGKRLVTHDSSSSEDSFASYASSVSTSDSRTSTPVPFDSDSTLGSPKPVTLATHLDPIPELTGRQRSKSSVWIQHPGQAETKQRGRSNAVWKKGRGRSDAIDQEPPNTGETSGRKRRKSF